MRSAQQPTNYFLIIMTFLIGLFLTILPLPQSIVWLWPQWMFAILLFWVITSPMQCGIFLAFMIGLWMDVVTGTAFGQHALVFVLLCYFILKNHSAIVHFPLFQQGMVVGIFAIVNVLLQGIVLHLTGHTPHDGLNLLSALTTFLVWPFLFVVLRSLRPKALIR